MRLVGEKCVYSQLVGVVKGMKGARVAEIRKSAVNPGTHALAG